MKPLFALFCDFLRDRRGATALEYGFIASLVSIAALTALRLIGPLVEEKFTSILPGLQ